MQGFLPFFGWRHTYKLEIFSRHNNQFQVFKEQENGFLSNLFFQYWEELKKGFHFNSFYRLHKPRRYNHTSLILIGTFYTISNIAEKANSFYVWNSALPDLKEIWSIHGWRSWKILQRFYFFRALYLVG